MVVTETYQQRDYVCLDIAETALYTRYCQAGCTRLEADQWLVKRITQVTSSHRIVRRNVEHNSLQDNEHSNLHATRVGVSIVTFCLTLVAVVGNVLMCKETGVVRTEDRRRLRSTIIDREHLRGDR